MRLSAWIRESKTGNKYMSGQIQPKREATPADTRQAPPSLDDFEDDLAF